MDGKNNKDKKGKSEENLVKGKRSRKKSLKKTQLPIDEKLPKKPKKQRRKKVKLTLQTTISLECMCGMHTGEIYLDDHALDYAKCSGCSTWQHAYCVNYDLTDPFRGVYKCPHCHVNTVSRY